MTAPALQTYVQGQGVVTADNFNSFEQTCDAVNQLRSITGVPGMQVFVRGTLIPADGGQGTFYWNAGGTAADDNGLTTIVPTGALVGVWTRIPGATIPTTQTGINVTSGTSFLVPTTTFYVGVKANTASPFTVVLPATPLQFESHVIKDASGKANLFNITISGGGNNIDFSLSYVMNIAHESVTIIFDGTQWNII